MKATGWLTVDEHAGHKLPDERRKRGDGIDDERGAQHQQQVTGSHVCVCELVKASRQRLTKENDIWAQHTSTRTNWLVLVFDGTPELSHVVGGLIAGIACAANGAEERAVTLDNFFWLQAHLALQMIDVLSVDTQQPPSVTQYAQQSVCGSGMHVGERTDGAEGGQCRLIKLFGIAFEEISSEGTAHPTLHVHAGAAPKVLDAGTGGHACPAQHDDAGSTACGRNATEIARDPCKRMLAPQHLAVVA